MRLKQVAEYLEQRPTGIMKANAETAKQRVAYLKSVQAWYQLRRAQAEEVKARQRFIQAAVASATSRENYI